MNVRSFSFPEKLHVTCREFVFCKDAHRLRVDAGRVLAANKACDSLSTANALMADEAATRLLNDEEFMLAAVEINALQQNYVLQYASEQLRSDAKFMLQAIHLDCETLHRHPPGYRLPKASSSTRCSCSQKAAQT